MADLGIILCKIYDINSWKRSFWCKVIGIKKMNILENFKDLFLEIAPEMGASLSLIHI